MDLTDSGSEASGAPAKGPLVADPLTAGLLAGKEEMDADGIREVLLLSASSILSLITKEVCALPNSTLPACA